MKKQFVLWDKQDGLKLADGIARTQEEVYAEVPNVRGAEHILLELTPSGNAGGVDDLAIIRQVYNIDDNLTVEEAVAEINRVANLPLKPVVDPLEAKLDYLVMMAE